jgi:integrase
MELTNQASVLTPTATPEREPLRLSPTLLPEHRKYSESFRFGQLRLCKKADSGIWRAIYRHPRTGKVTQSSLGTTLKKEAQIHAEQWSAQLTNKKLGVSDGTAPIKSLFDEYFRATKGRNAVETLKRIQSSWHMFDRWLAKVHPTAKLVRHITPSIVRDYQNHRVDDKGVSKRTADNDVANLHTVFRWGEREGLVAKSPFDYSKHGTVQLYDEPPPDLETYSDEEYHLLIKEAERVGDLLIRDMIIVLADTGMRFGELQHLTPEALHWETDPPHIDIRARNGWKPKDPKEKKLIPMSVAVIDVLKRRETTSDGGLLFHNREGNPIAENHTRDRFKALFPAVGIKPGRRLHWHSWRNHYILRCLNAGMAVHHIMRWTGHDSVGMVLHYADVKTRDKDGFNEFRKMPNRDKFGTIALSSS